PKVRHVTRNTILMYCLLEHERLKLIKEWDLKSKVFSMTCDNAGAMDVMVGRLKSDLHSFFPLPLEGRFFHVHYCAFILNLIFQSGMKVIDDSVFKVCGAVNYIASSDSRLCVFDKCVVDSQCNFIGKLRIDCPTRWHSTYLMLKRVIKAKKALSLFCTIDPSFDFVPVDEEWEIVKYMCNFLEPFDCITNLFSKSNYPTANIYFPYILAVENLFVLGHNHKVPSIKDMASAMLVKFEKYWGYYSIVLGITILLDPRYKNVMIRSALGRLYNSGEVQRRVKEIREAFIDYTISMTLLLAHL
ncbi:putative AC transposase, partial [Bienertia sinuspersici]